MKTIDLKNAGKRVVLDEGCMYSPCVLVFFSETRNLLIFWACPFPSFSAMANINWPGLLAWSILEKTWHTERSATFALLVVGDVPFTSGSERWVPCFFVNWRVSWSEKTRSTLSMVNGNRLVWYQCRAATLLNSKVPSITMGQHHRNSSKWAKKIEGEDLFMKQMLNISFNIWNMKHHPPLLHSSLCLFFSHIHMATLP